MGRNHQPEMILVVAGNHGCFFFCVFQQSVPKMEETQLHECRVRESDPMTSQYRCGGYIRIYPWYLILDTHSPYIYIHTYFYILYYLFSYIHIYIFYSNIHTVLNDCILTVLLFWTHTHTFESTDVGPIYFVANPRKWWSIESSLRLRLSNPVEIAVVTLQQAGRGGWYWLCGELLRVAQRPLESTINQKTHSKLHSRKRT